jgi:hypothetical protein
VQRVLPFHEFFMKKEGRTLGDVETSTLRDSEDVSELCCHETEASRDILRSGLTTDIPVQE